MCRKRLKIIETEGVWEENTLTLKQLHMDGGNYTVKRGEKWIQNFGRKT